MEEQVKTDTVEQEVSNEQELDKDFLDFKNNSSDYEVQQEEEAKQTAAPETETKNQSSGGEPLPAKDTFVKNDTFDNFKLQMFMGIFFGLVDGLHLFIFNFISKHKLIKEDIAFDEDDREAVMHYFNTSQVMALINKLPDWLVGIVHVEWIYYNKYKEAIEDKEEQALIEAEEKAAEEERERKRSATRKKKAKKKPAKKKLNEKNA